MFLNGGRYNGRQIVPADWVTRSTAAQALGGADDAARRNIERPVTPFPAFYAWQWRRIAAAAEPGSAPRQPGTDFYAQGLHGQVLYIAPGTDTVVLRLGSRWGEVPWPAWLGRVARANP